MSIYLMKGQGPWQTCRQNLIASFEHEVPTLRSWQSVTCNHYSFYWLTACQFQIVSMIQLFLCLDPFFYLVHHHFLPKPGPLMWKPLADIHLQPPSNVLHLLLLSIQACTGAWACSWWDWLSIYPLLWICPTSQHIGKLTWQVHRSPSSCCTRPMLRSLLFSSVIFSSDMLS